MPITLPNLDDRRYADLVEEARDLLVANAPALTNHNPSSGHHARGAVRLFHRSAVVPREQHHRRKSHEVSAAVEWTGLADPTVARWFGRGDAPHRVGAPTHGSRGDRSGFRVPRRRRRSRRTHCARVLHRRTQPRGRGAGAIATATESCQRRDRPFPDGRSRGASRSSRTTSSRVASSPPACTWWSTSRAQSAFA